MTLKSIPKAINNRSRTGPGSNVVFWSIVDQILTLQTLKNIKNLKEHIGFSRVGPFRIDHVFDSTKTPKLTSNINQQSTNKHILKTIGFWSERWPQSDPNMNPKIVQQSILGPTCPPRRAQEDRTGPQRPNYDDFWSILDRFLTDFEAIWDRFRIDLGQICDHVST